jgi:23S rRNA (uracil1939-C5)-methyltransferase
MIIKSLAIVDYTHDGMGIGKADGFAYFVKGVAVGDVVDVTVLKDMKSYAIAKVERVLSSSTIAAACEHYETCGGCHVMHLSTDDQQDFKTRKVSNAITRIAKLTNQNISVIPTLKPWHYRNKVRFHVVNGELGYFEEKSHTLVHITNCLVASPILMRVANSIPFLHDLRGVTLRTNETQSQLMVILEGQVDHPSAIDWAREQGVTSLYLADQELHHLHGEETYQERYQNLVFSIGPQSFFQIAPTMAYQMFETAMSWIEMSNKHVVDLYSGVGVIGLLAARTARKVTMIESNPHAVTEAIQNIKQNHKTNVEVLQGSVHQHLHKVEDLDVIVVDPPRSGMDQKTKNLILQTKAPFILYVSCEPSTMARDLLDFKETYQIEKTQSFDMFSQTYHVESVVLLSLKSA